MQKTTTQANPSKPLKEDPLKTCLESLNTFSKEDIIKVRDRADSIIKRREKSERKALVEALKKTIKKHGIKPSEIMDTDEPTGAKKDTKN